MATHMKVHAINNLAKGSLVQISRNDSKRERASDRRSRKEIKREKQMVTVIKERYAK